MMEWTDRHCRFFHRLLTRRALIYTEMVTTGAVLHGDRERLIGFRSGRASGGVAAWRQRSRGAGALRPDRRGFRLRRDQSQHRLPVGARAGRPLRRLPDGGAGAGRRLRRGHEGRGRDPGDGQVPHRHRRAGPGGGAGSFRHGGRGGRRRRADRARAQGLARRPVAAREPRHPAARLRHRVPSQGRASEAADRAQRRHRHGRGGARASGARRRRHDGPRRLSGAVAAA